MIRLIKKTRFRTTVVGLMLLLAGCGGDDDQESGKSANTSPVVDESMKVLAPTGLTIVASDEAGKILDSVVVPDDGVSYFVEFTIPEGEEELRMFALGHRLSAEMSDIAPGKYFIGRPRDDEWHGLGYVEAYIDKGLLAGMKGNGWGTFQITDSMKKEIEADIKEAKAATFTTFGTVEE